MSSGVSFILNGKNVNLQEDDGRPLLWVLRTDLGLTGTKYGCGEGHCGSCRILLDKEVFPSCQLSLGDVAGRSVTTIEGLAKNGSLHPVQRAFVKEEALQCGYCTPGMIMTALALLYKNPSPGEDEILAAFDDNLCRCGSYKRIIRAVRSAALLMKEER